MGTFANVGFLLLGLAVSAVWMRAIFPLGLRRHCIGNLLGGVGIFALTFSAISPDDDLLQPELIRPAAQSSNVLRPVRVPRTDLIGAFPVIAPSSPALPVRPDMPGKDSSALKHVHRRMLHITSVSIHPPPLPL